MTTKQFEDIKAKYGRAKEKANRAEGAMGALMEQIKTEFKIDTLEELEKESIDMQNEIDELNEEISALEDKLETVTDWSAL